MPASSDQPANEPELPNSQRREQASGGEGGPPVPSNAPAVVKAALPAGVALHARPAGDLVRAASRLQAQVTISATGKRANARSILEVLALGATGGTELTITASGPGAAEAASTLAEVIASLGT